MLLHFWPLESTPAADSFWWHLFQDNMVEPDLSKKATVHISSVWMQFIVLCLLWTVASYLYKYKLLIFMLSTLFHVIFGLITDHMNRAGSCTEYLFSWYHYHIWKLYSVSIGKYMEQCSVTLCSVMKYMCDLIMQCYIVQCHEINAWSFL